MRRKRWLSAIFIYFGLELAALLGAPVRPDQVEEMTRLLKQTATRIERRDDNASDPPTRVVPAGT